MFVTELKYITSTKNRSGRNLVIAHQAGRFDPNEPRASEARYEDYKRTKDYTPAGHCYDEYE